MNRLTEYHAGVAVFKDKRNLKEAAEKLAQYEETGMTPEQVEELIKKQRPMKIDRRVLPRDLKIGNVKFRAGTTTYHCPSCGKAVTGGCIYCPHCSQALDMH